MCINRCLMRNAVVRCISCLRVFIVLNAVCECDRASTDRFWYFSRFMIIAWKFILKKKTLMAAVAAPTEQYKRQCGALCVSLVQVQVQSTLAFEQGGT